MNLECERGNVKRGLTSDGDERDEEVRRIGGDEVRESGGEDVGSVPNSAATPVYELQLLALFRGDEIVENQPRVLSLSLPHFLSYESKNEAPIRVLDPNRNLRNHKLCQAAVIKVRTNFRGDDKRL